MQISNELRVFGVEMRSSHCVTSAAETGRVKKDECKPVGDQAYVVKKT